MAWQRMIRKTFGHEPMHLVAQLSHNGPIVGVLPLFLVRSRIFGRLLVSTPQAAYGGILANSDVAAKALFQMAAQLAKEQNVEFLELRTFRNPVLDDSVVSKDLYV